MTPPKLFWKLVTLGLTITGAGAIIETVFPLPGDGWMDDIFDVFGDDDAEL
jgi:hypothetical protein